VVLLGMALASPALSLASAEDRLPADIRDLLQSKCLRCHGGKSPKGGLDLSSPEGVHKGGESGPVVVAGQPDRSLLYEKVHEGSMPPGKKGRLSEAEVAVVRHWIQRGASVAGADAPPTLTQHDVLPILLRRCTVCHGALERQANLDLRSRDSILRGGKSGPAIVPGKPRESLLIRKIHEGQMPPLSRLIEVSIKPIEPGEIEQLTRWVEQGAPAGSVQPDVATHEPDPLVTDKDRDFWSFRTPRPVPVPALPHAGPIHNPIDAFLLQKLQARGLTFSPVTDRRTLIRRLSLDLTGLPPQPDEVEAFVADTAPDAYERLVERLLASPRYGERWGRHWLDLAGYADSEGKREQDLARGNAWRYRDYVIRSFNADKPYDRFLLEQLAGDELHDYEHAGEITPAMYDDLVATGFLRLAPDPTWYNLTNFVPDRLEVIADEVEVLGSAVLGLTMKCARCHSHKFDPIPQRDYYRLLAVFKGAFDEHDWMKSNWLVGLSSGQRTDRNLPFVTTAERRAWQAQESAIDKEIASLQAQLDQRAGGKANREQLRKRDPAFRKAEEETQRHVQALQARRTPEPTIRALWDRGEPSPTYIYQRGDYLSPGRLVGPGVPSVLTDGRTPLDVQPPWPGANKTGRRLAFARWLIRPDHPLTARVMVNRIWKHHFGTGLVPTLDNFGRAGARPTHPELLDFLALEFVRSGWSIKAMHRLMVTSAAYRQSSAVTPELDKQDPENLLYSRMPLQRLDAEQFYDAMLLACGRLEERPFGPADAVVVRPDGLATPASSPRGWRRGLYVQQQRKVVATHLEAFDFPQMNPNCIERRHSTVAPQALYLMNNGMIDQLAEEFARRVRREAGSDPQRQVERIYQIAFSRPPQVAERTLGVTTLARLAREWGPGETGAAQRALTTYCHAILNCAEFLYVD
jgi:hypothetical protein